MVKKLEQVEKLCKGRGLKNGLKKCWIMLKKNVKIVKDVKDFENGKKWWKSWKNVVVYETMLRNIVYKKIQKKDFKIVNVKQFQNCRNMWKTMENVYKKIFVNNVCKQCI